MLLILTSLVLLLGPLALAQQCKLVLADQGQIVLGPTPTSSSLGPNGTQANPSGTSNGSSPSPTISPFNYGSTKIRGVNLGGWFVLEPWITPSIFQNTNNTDIIDEFTFCQMQESNVALQALTNHWSTWITEDDFIAIQAAGLNHVRMQIGYWSIPITSADTNYTTDVSPYIPGAWPYLLQALNWAKTHGLHVILDLHGAPGSQNGFDNSGQRGIPTWGTDTTDIPRTLDIIKFIANKLGGLIDVLELINEATVYSDGQQAVISGYYQQGYQVVRNTTGSSMQVMIGDAFLGVQGWQGFLTPPSAQGVLMDFHEYQIFNFDQLSSNLTTHIDLSCQTLTTLSTFENSNIYTIIGEFTTSPTDCALWVNGRGVGARWDGTWQPNQQTFGNCTGFTGNMSTFSADYKTFLRQYWEAQVTIGENIQGWLLWTWKTESADEWSYQRGLQGGWIPQNPTSRLYPNLCTGS